MMVSTLVSPCNGFVRRRILIANLRSVSVAITTVMFVTVKDDAMSIDELDGFLGRHRRNDIAKSVLAS